MTSTRLPGKVLLAAGGHTMLEHHVRRLQSTNAQVIVATTVNRTDDPIARSAEELGASIFRGSEHDVLSRFASAAELYSLDVVVRVTSDCPLIDGDVVQLGIDEFLRRNDPSVYLSNTVRRTFPRGFDFEVFSASALHDAANHATTLVDREHVTPYISQNSSGRFRVCAITHTHDASQYRVTLDTVEDFSLIRTLIEQYGAAHLSAAGIIELLDQHPELVQINAQVEQKKLDGR